MATSSLSLDKLGMTDGLATTTVREATRALLRALGMTTVFGNPGSTELKFFRDWPADFRYIMALHEGCAVPMADAYSQITRNAALVSLHSAGGLGNALGTIYTAYRNNAPLVILAGQQTRAMLSSEPFLSATDAASFPRPYVKWSIEPPRAADVPGAIARAYHVAMERPYGPTFVSIPEDDWDAETTAPVVRRVDSEFVAGSGALDELAAAINASRNPALVVGPGVDRDDAVAAVIALAERIQARVFASALSSRCSFAEDHELYAGALPRIRSGVVRTLAVHDLVVVLGAPAFLYHIHSEGPFVADGTTVFHLTDDPAAASYAVVGTSIITALRPALEALLPRVAFKPLFLPAPHTNGAATVARGEQITMPLLLETLRETMPADAIVVEEAPCTHTVLHDYKLFRPGAYFTAASGSLGYGLPAAIGAALAAPGRRIVALIGDGSSYYGIQALWTAAQHRLPITFLIANNSGYGAMRQFVNLQGLTGTPSFDVGAVDISALATGFGCRALRVEAPGELRPMLEASMQSTGPIVLDIVLDRALPTLY
jgi:benzoylformate decarboxylase